MSYSSFSISELIGSSQVCFCILLIVCFFFEILLNFKEKGAEKKIKK